MLASLISPELIFGLRTVAPIPGRMIGGSSLKRLARLNLAVTRARSFRAALALSFAFGLGACGDDSPPGCVPGQSIACARSGCSDGHQVCAADGRSYGECSCEDSSAEFPKTGPNSGLIGAACTSSSNCRPGLECLRQDSSLIGGEGPSAGLCLARCLPEHDFCSALDARSKCVVLDEGESPDPLDDVAYCLPGCELGTQPHELDKCRSRTDLVCTEGIRGSGVGYCRPACRADLDCGDRYCNLGTGLCADQPTSGTPIGAACSSGESECAGACLDHPGGFSECSGVCRYGTPGCGQTGAEDPLEYFCFLDPAPGSGEGDLGYCAKLCDCDADCAREDAVCEPRSTLDPSLGRAGVCGSRRFPSGSLRSNIPCSGASP